MGAMFAIILPVQTIINNVGPPNGLRCAQFTCRYPISTINPIVIVAMN